MNLNDCKLLILFGGSFDPPHNAHIILPFIAQKQLSSAAEIPLEKTLLGFIPAALSPFKTLAPPTASKHRLAMLKLALQNEKRAIIITDEIDNFSSNTPSYTIDTIKALKKQIPSSATMRLLIGTDQMLDFEKWKDYKQIIKLAEPAVMLRPPYTREEILNKLTPNQRNSWLPRLVDIPKLNISATNIRQRIMQNKPIDNLVPPKVKKYIKEHNLYQSNTH